MSNLFLSDNVNVQRSKVTLEYYCHEPTDTKIDEHAFVKCVELLATVVSLFAITQMYNGRNTKQNCNEIYVRQIVYHLRYYIMCI